MFTQLNASRNSSSLDTRKKNKSFWLDRFQYSIFDQFICGLNRFWIHLLYVSISKPNISTVEDDYTFPSTAWRIRQLVLLTKRYLTSVSHFIFLYKFLFVRFCLFPKLWLLFNPSRFSKQWFLTFFRLSTKYFYSAGFTITV